MSARLAIWGVVLIWGANFSVIKAALADFDPLAFNALRFPVGSLVLAAFWAIADVRGDRPNPSGRERAASHGEGFLARFDRRDWPALIGLGILGHVVYQPFFILGLERTLVGNSSLLLATTPVWVAILSVELGHERLPARTWGGIALSFVGIALVVLGGARAVEFGRSTVTGDLLTLGAAALWAAYTVGASPFVRRYGALPFTAITMWIGTVGLVLTGLPALFAQDWGAVRLEAWAGLLYSSLLGVGVAYLLWYTSVGAVGSTRTAVASYATPLVAIAIAWAMLGEQPTGLQLVGAAAILSGVMLARRERPRRGEAGIPPEEV